MQDIDQVFVSLQGLTTVVSQQVVKLEGLHRTIRQKIGAQRSGILPHLSRAGEDVYTVGDYFATSSEIENFIKDEGSLVGELFGSLSAAEKADVIKSCASLALDIVDRVSKITSASTSDGTKYLPAVLPAELAKVRTHAFISDVLQLQTERLLATKSRQYINDIETEHREFFRTVSSEMPLREALENQPKSVGFSEAWAVCQGRFFKLREFCGVLATVFPGTVTFESDFSNVNWEKSDYRSNRSFT
jgi:hypothetical protein